MVKIFWKLVLKIYLDLVFGKLVCVGCKKKGVLKHKCLLEVLK